MTLDDFPRYPEGQSTDQRLDTFRHRIWAMSGRRFVSEDDGTLDARVDVKREDVRRRIVADGVEHPPERLHGGHVEVRAHELLALTSRLK